MRDFTIDEIVQEMARDYPLIPVRVIKRICKGSLQRIIQIMQRGNANIFMKNADIHSIYREVDLFDAMADLDETRMDTAQAKLTEYQEREGKGVFTGRVRGRGKVKRIYNTRPPANKLYPGSYPEDCTSELHRPVHSGTEVQVNSEETGERDIQKILVGGDESPHGV